MVKSKYSKYLLKLSKAQAKKLAKSQNTIIKPDQMEGGEVEIYMSPAKHRKMMTALRKKKGMKLGLSPDELDMCMTGSGFKDLLKRGVKEVVKASKPAVKKAVSKSIKSYVGNKVADTVGSIVSDVGEKGVNMVVDKYGGKLPMGEHLSGLDCQVGGKIRLKDVSRGIEKGFKSISEGYKKNVRNTPVGDAIRTGVKSAIVTGATALPVALGQPQLAPVAGMVAKPLADIAVEKAGLGMKCGGKLQSNSSNFLNSQHPAMFPNIPNQGVTDLPRTGGSFMAGGSFVTAGYRRGGAISYGTPMNPTLPVQGYSDIPRNITGDYIPLNPSTSFFSGN